MSKIVGNNVRQIAEQRPEDWDPIVRMWVYEETLPSGELLSEVINHRHENVKYVLHLWLSTFSRS